MEEKHYSLSKKLTYFEIIQPLFISIIIVPILELYAIALFVGLLAGEVQINSEQGFQFLLALIWPIFWTIGVWNQINLYPKIKVTDLGMWVRILRFRFVWKFIPWEQVNQIEKSPKKYRGYDIWLISINTNLSIWHKRLNRRYGLSEDPYIFISSAIFDIDDLVTDIPTAIGKDVGKQTTQNVISIA